MFFSSHHSLRNHVAEKDHYISHRPNSNKVGKAQLAKKCRKEMITFIVNFLNKASAAESVEETQRQNDQEDKWQCKQCTEKQINQGRNQLIVCDNCGDKYHLYDKEGKYYDIYIEYEEFHCDKCET